MQRINGDTKVFAHLMYSICICTYTVNNMYMYILFCLSGRFARGHLSPGVLSVHQICVNINSLDGNLSQNWLCTNLTCLNTGETNGLVL